MFALPRPVTSRRAFLAGTAVTMGAVVTGCSGDEVAPLQRPEHPTPDQALQLIHEGNQRWVRGDVRRPRSTDEARRAVAVDQHPFVNLISCVDSRVPSETVFDQGLGEMLVVRLPGNVVVDDVIATAQFGVEEFEIPLIVVLGHQRCGALRAALEAEGDGSGAPGRVGLIIENLAPAVQAATGEGDQRLISAVRSNVARRVETLREDPVLRERIEHGALRVEGGYYTLDSGMVTFV